MSSMEYWNGKFAKYEFPSENLTWDEKLDFLIKDGWEIDKECCDENEYIELIRDWDLERKNQPMLKVLNGEVYKIFDYRRTIDCDELGVQVNRDSEQGVFNFHGSFYNGGTHITEVLEDGLKKLSCDKEAIVVFSKRMTNFGDNVCEIFSNILQFKRTSSRYKQKGGSFVVTVKWEEMKIEE